MSGEYFPALDGLRAVAVLTVLGTHSNPIIFYGGRIGVDIFFVLSGFLITSILFKEITISQNINLKNFFARRALRLFPALSCVILFAIFIDIFLKMETPRQTLTSVVSTVVYMQNWGRVWETYNHPSLGIFTTWWNGHLWSLSVEEQFYIISPLLILLLARTLKSINWVPLLTIPCLIYPLAVRLAYADNETFQTAAYFRTDLHMDSLLWGVLAAWIHHQKYTQAPFFTTQIRTTTAITSAMLLIWFIVAPPFPDSAQFSAAALVSTLLLLTLVSSQSGFIFSFLTLRPMQWLGRISYGLYIWHIPIYVLIYRYISIDQRLETIIAVTLSIFTAAISYKLVELPFLKLKDRFPVPKN